MKTLTRLRLINWHLFANEDMDIKNITFLTGANGTGKSTIIDAIQIVLLADTSGRNFNKAANDRTGRTLSGYLRCETGQTADGQVICLRPGRFTSYIALQFRDDKRNEDFTLGIVFDSYEDDSEEHHFFYLRGKFPENGFTTKDMLPVELPRPLTYKELSKYFADSYDAKDFRFFDSNLAYHDFLKDLFGNMPEKYFTLFKKAVSFSPITNISNFITEFVCDIDYKIDISAMQNNIEQYKLLEVEAKKIQEKIDGLTEIQNAYKAYKSEEEKLGMADYMVDRVNFDKASDSLKSALADLEKQKQRIREIDALLIDKEHQENELKEEKENYLAKKVGSAGYSLTATLQSKKNQALEKIAALQTNYASLSNTLKDYLKLYGDALSGLSAARIDSDLSFLSDDESDALESLSDQAREFMSLAKDLVGHLDDRTVREDEITEAQQEMASIHTSAMRLDRMIENSIMDLSRSSDALDKELNEIHEGHKPFSSIYLQVRSALEEALKERHPNAKVTSYCDLVDIRDKRWTRAIEAMIYNQKFNFFVEEDYYDEAAKLLSRICREFGYYAVSVVDTGRLLDHGFDADRGSVAEEIETDDDGARVYSNFLLGRLKKCETFEEARKSGNGLLPNCTGYRNYASFYLNEKRAEISYLGTKVDEETILAKKDQFSQINKELSLYRELANVLHNITRLEVLSTSESNTFKADISSLARIDELNAEVDRLEQAMKEGESGEVSVYDGKIRSIDEDLASLESEKAELLKEQGGLENSVKVLNSETIPSATALMNHYKEALEGFSKVLVEEKYGPFYDKACANLSMQQIVTQSRQLYIQTQDKVNSLRGKLLNLRRRYVIEQHLSYDPEVLANNDDFDKELSNLQQVLLPSYTEKIASAHIKATKEFKDDFIYKLRTAFDTIRSQIDDLNLALKDVRFGKDSYRFTVSPNKDYMEYYQMITDDLLLNVGDAEDVYLEKYRDTMNNLFNLISDSTDRANGDLREQIIANVEKFTDYRTYLNFDLVVRRGNSQTESSLARTFKQQSGGETQTPFYISILASFAQLYRTNDPDSDSLRLVIFDEAFSKMDGEHIKQSVGLLKSFGLQAILSTPSEKLRDLSKIVDLVLVTIHDAKRNRSYIDRYEDTDPAKDASKTGSGGE